MTATDPSPSAAVLPASVALAATPQETNASTCSMWRIAQAVKPYCESISTFSSTYTTPFASFWGAARNAVGLAWAICTFLSVLSVISCPQLLIALTITYAVFVLIQGALAGGPTFLGNLCGAIKEYIKAKELNDPELYTSATMKLTNALFSLAEGGFWAFIGTARLLAVACPAIALFGVSVTVATNLLYFVLFNVTFAYMTGVAIYDFIRHKRFYDSINVNFLNALADNARELNRIEELTNEKCRIKLKSWLNSEGVEAESLIQDMKQASLQNMVRDGITIALGVIGLLLSFDVFIADISTPFISEVIDWAAWVFINLAFLLLLDWGKSANEIQAAGARALSPSALPKTPTRKMVLV